MVVDGGGFVRARRRGAGLTELVRIWGVVVVVVVVVAISSRSVPVVHLFATIGIGNPRN